jgi:hypothetical protein
MMGVINFFIEELEGDIKRRIVPRVGGVFVRNRLF